jgi:hypothetical protein
MKTFNQFLNETETLEEKNKPTQPEKWARAKAAAKSKFAVYPSAYANAWASKKYKSMGGGWRSTKEELEQEEISKPEVEKFHKKLDTLVHSTFGKRPDEKKKMKEEVEFYEEYDAEELFDILEEIVDGIAEENNIDPDILWENLEDVSDEELYETAAWRRKEGKNPTGGLNRKGIMSYRRENPGSKLSMAVTGKVKPGSKAAKRRKSFCARMGGMKGPMKKPNGKPTRKALALRKWKCR